MIQIELDKIEVQQFQVRKLLDQLMRFKGFKGANQNVSAGCLVETNQGYFLLGLKFYVPSIL
jgi:hypothetical protein